MITLGLVALAVVALVLQGSLFPFLIPGGVQPDLVLVFVLAYSFMSGEKKAMAMGLGMGFVQDLLFGTPPGMFALTKFISSFLMGFVSKFFNREIILIPMGLCLFFTIMHELMVVFFRGLVLSSTLFIGNLLLYVILPRALVNMIALAAVYPLMVRMVPKERLFSSRG